MEKKYQDQLIQNLMFELKDFAIIMIDRHGYIQSWNHAAERIKGYTEDEVIGKNFRIFYPEKDRREGKPDKLLQTAIHEGRAIDKGWRIHKDGSKFWGSVVITAIHNNEGEIIGFTKITQDLTKQKNLENRFSNIIENAPDSMLLVDREGRIQITNQQAENTFGYNKKELINQKVELLLPAQYRNNHPGLRREYMLEPYTRPMGNGLNLTGLRKNGEEFPVEISISPLSDSREDDLQIIVTIRDITDKKALLNEIIASKEKAEESNRLKSAFLATMSHELRTPLNHIIGFANIISDTTTDQEISGYATIIQNSGASLLAIIEDIISLATMENKFIKLRSEVLSLSEFLSGIKVIAQKILTEAGKQNNVNLIFKIDDEELLPKEIVTDKYKLYQAIINLINNAVKYTQQGSVTIRLFQPDKATIAISIGDTGIGIAADKQKEIFDFFRQVDDSNTRVYGGIGAGLTIAEKIANFMGGKITLSSELGKGSDFTFVLPIDISQTMEE